MLFKFVRSISKMSLLNCTKNGKKRLRDVKIEYRIVDDIPVHTDYKRIKTAESCWDSENFDICYIHGDIDICSLYECNRVSKEEYLNMIKKHKTGSYIT
jgi:hypothetical protein